MTSCCTTAVVSTGRDLSTATPTAPPAINANPAMNHSIGISFNTITYLFLGTFFFKCFFARSLRVGSFLFFELDLTCFLSFFL